MHNLFMRAPGFKFGLAPKPSAPLRHTLAASSHLLAPSVPSCPRPQVPCFWFIDLSAIPSGSGAGCLCPQAGSLGLPCGGSCAVIYLGRDHPSGAETLYHQRRPRQGLGVKGAALPWETCRLTLSNSRFKVTGQEVQRGPRQRGGG